MLILRPVEMRDLDDLMQLAGLRWRAGVDSTPSDFDEPGDQQEEYQRVGYLVHECKEQSRNQNGDDLGSAGSGEQGETDGSQAIIKQGDRQSRHSQRQSTGRAVQLFQ